MTVFQKVEPCYITLQHLPRLLLLLMHFLQHGIKPNELGWGWYLLKPDGTLSSILAVKSIFPKSYVSVLPVDPLRTK